MSQSRDELLNGEVEMDIPEETGHITDSKKSFLLFHQATPKTFNVTSPLHLKTYLASSGSLKAPPRTLTNTYSTNSSFQQDMEKFQTLTVLKRTKIRTCQTTTTQVQVEEEEGMGCMQ